MFSGRPFVESPRRGVLSPIVWIGVDPCTKAFMVGRSGPGSTVPPRPRCQGGSFFVARTQGREE